MSTHQSEPAYFSRSALAEKLDISLKELTQLMIEAGWILQEGKVWKLTAKGEFEGGIYRQSQKYGQYIVWPEAVLVHPILRGTEQTSVHVTLLAKSVNLPARLFNRLLAELGWIEAFAKGWQLTSLGKRYGGVQCQDDDSGIPYVMWPRSVRDMPVLTRSIDAFIDQESNQALNGLEVESSAHRQIANWLYIVGLSYSYQRELLLPDDTELMPDFYLPSHRIAIDYWSESLKPDELAMQLQKREDYKKFEIQVVEIHQDKLSDLDHELSRKLLQLGITVY